MKIDSHEKLLATAQSVIDIEAAAVQALKQRLGDDFVKACETIIACQGRVVVG